MPGDPPVDVMAGPKLSEGFKPIQILPSLMTLLSPSPNLVSMHAQDQQMPGNPPVDVTVIPKLSGGFKPIQVCYVLSIIYAISLNPTSNHHTCTEPTDARGQTC